MKKGRISNTEKEFIKQNKHLDINTLAKEIGRTVESVEYILENLPKKVNKNQKNIMFSGKKKTAMVMTPAASEIGDKDKNKKRFNQDYMHRPMGNK